MGYKTPYKNIACKVSDFFAMIRSIDGKNSKAGFWYCLYENSATFRIHLNRLVVTHLSTLKTLPAGTASGGQIDTFVGSVGTLTLHCTQGENLGYDYQARPQI